MKKRVGILVIAIIAIALVVKLNVNSSISVNGNTTGNVKGDVQLEGKRTNEETGRNRLIELEKLNVDDIESKIKESIKPDKKEQLLPENGQVDFKKYYKTTVFFGDSLTEFMSTAEILTKNSVVATKGRNVITAKQDIEKIKAINPERIIMLFGMNDVENFLNPSDFKDKYSELITEMKLSLPKTEIYIQSPMPVKNKEIKSSSRVNNENITKFREMAKEVAKIQGVKYVDTSVLVTDEKYFEPDGMHLKYDFYPKLLKYLIDMIENDKVK